MIETKERPIGRQASYRVAGLVTLAVMFGVAPLVARYAVGNPVEGLAFVVLLVIAAFLVCRPRPTDGTLSFRWIPIAWIAMIFISDHQFLDLTRDPLLAAEGSASTENLLEIAVYALVAAMVLRSRRLLVRQVPTKIPKATILLFPGFALASVLWSEIALFSLTRASQLLAMTAFVLLMVRIWQTHAELGERVWRATLAAFVQLVTLLSLIGLVFGTGVFGRFSWPGTHPGVASSWTGLALLILLVGGRKVAPSPAWTYSLRLLLFAFVLGIGKTRSVYAALALALLVVIWDVGRERPIARYLGIWYYGVAVLGLVVFAQNQAVTFLSRGSTAEELSTLSGRIPLWESAIEDVAAAGAWLQGFGYGAARVVLYPDFQWAGTAHNSWMEAMLGVGLIGVLLLLTDVLYLIWRLAWGDSPHRSSRLALGMLVYLLALSATSEMMVVPGLGFGLLALIHVPALGRRARVLAGGAPVSGDANAARLRAAAPSHR